MSERLQIVVMGTVWFKRAYYYYDVHVSVLCTLGADFDYERCTQSVPGVHFSQSLIRTTITVLSLLATIAS